MPWDWRILLNGKGDEMMYERHLIVTGGLPFAELKARSLINGRAKAANASPDFSLLIRVGLPPFTRAAVKLSSDLLASGVIVDSLRSFSP